MKNRLNKLWRFLHGNLNAHQTACHSLFRQNSGILKIYLDFGFRPGSRITPASLLIGEARAVRFLISFGFLNNSCKSISCMARSLLMPRSPCSASGSVRCGCPCIPSWSEAAPCILENLYHNNCLCGSGFPGVSASSSDPASAGSGNWLVFR